MSMLDGPSLHESDPRACHAHACPNLDRFLQSHRLRVEPGTFVCKWNGLTPVGNLKWAGVWPKPRLWSSSIVEEVEAMTPAASASSSR